MQSTGTCTLQVNILDLRSEEHTSELQSRLHLVCRLLLEKKKKKRTHVYEPGQRQSAMAALGANLKDLVSEHAGCLSCVPLRRRGGESYVRGRYCRRMTRV